MDAAATTDAAIHAAGDCAPGCPVCEAEADAADPCPVCGGGFTADSYAARHTGPAPEYADIHAGCCGQCEEDERGRRPRLDRRTLRSFPSSPLLRVVQS